MTYPIHIGTDSPAQLKAFAANTAFSQVVVLADTNTAVQCYPLVKPLLPEHTLIEIPAGEQHKTLDTCQHVWQQLSRINADRWTLLLNVGGGMVGDLGGFCAAVYKRGIRFAQVPTSLLAQVDASVGGKAGVDFEGAKNQLGVFQDPAAVFVDPGFLKTLPLEEQKSGYAEILKHCLIADAERFEKERFIGLFSEDWLSLIRHSIDIKSRIVEADPLESGLRKVLNFGHTVGHAIEGYFLQQEQSIPHGYAVAAGIVCESYLSFTNGMLSQRDLDKIYLFVFSIYDKLPLPPQHLQAIAALALNDKKNSEGKVMCTFLAGIGKAEYNQPVTLSELQSALQFYLGL